MSDSVYSIKSPKKLIEVALPLDAINKECAHEKMPGIGAHPRSIHLWWARRPLAAARAVIFAQMVNDPGWRFELEGRTPSPQEKGAITKKRQKLFKIMEELVVWKNTTNELVLKKAQDAIRESWVETCELNKSHPKADVLFNPQNMPALYDPFAGGGAIPLEAQRLGLEAYASDLNPIPVMINKAMLEFPSIFSGNAPVHPYENSDWTKTKKAKYYGVEGLAEDVEYYGHLLKSMVESKLGFAYPKVRITKEMAESRNDLVKYVGKELKIISWIWTRTVKSTNPAFSHVDVPLVSSFILSKKKGREAWIKPNVNGESYSFEVLVGEPPKDAGNGTQVSQGSFRCLLSGSEIKYEYIDEEANAGRLSKRLMAVVAEGVKERVYLSPQCVSVPSDDEFSLSWKPDYACRGTFASNAQGRRYGFSTFTDYFSKRQLATLNAFCDFLPEVTRKIKEDALCSGMSDDLCGIEQQGRGALAYAQAVTVYLSFAIDRTCDFNNTVCRWSASNEKIMNLFSKQGIAMTWDYPEGNVLSDCVGSFVVINDFLAKSLRYVPATIPGHAQQADAQIQNISLNKVISTDPPYYNNMAYSDLSDFFYVWMRHNLSDIFPSLFTTMLAPKDDELIASPYRHDSNASAEKFFLEGMTKAMRRLCEDAHEAFPITIYYAFKASKSTDKEVSSAGWETFLQAVIDAGLSIVGTWPMRSEQSARMIGMDSNALASSIVLVCRKKNPQAISINRRDFQRELNSVMNVALEQMTFGGENSPVAPVDLSQAIIGPGMSVFSKYKSVLKADGSAMTVHEALNMINRFMSDGDFDNETLFCKDWFVSHWWEEASYGEADVLARAKAADITRLGNRGVIQSGQGKVRITNWRDYTEEMIAETYKPISAWLVLHLCIHELNEHGIAGAARIYAKYKVTAASARSLAYVLYTLCERAGKAEDARYYNELIVAWESIETSAPSANGNPQISFLGDEIV